MAGDHAVPHSESGWCQACGKIVEGPPEVKNGGANPGNRPLHPASQRFHEILRELGALHNKKQADYGTDTDPFANVRGSTEWGVPAWVGALVRANDKIKRLQSFARKGVLANESVQDSLRDLAVYAVISLVLYEQEAKDGDPVR